MSDDFDPAALHPEDVPLDPDYTSEMSNLRPLVTDDDTGALEALDLDAVVTERDAYKDLAQRLQAQGETPAAMVAISPLLQLEKDPKLAHPNIYTDAMFPPKAFDALVALVARAAAKNIVDGEPEGVYEPLDHIEPGLPRTLIHVSGSEVLLHDARLAARRLAAAGVPTEVRVWPGQIHDFQLAAPLIPEAKRSLRQIGEYIREATG